MALPTPIKHKTVGPHYLRNTSILTLTCKAH